MSMRRFIILLLAQLAALVRSQPPDCAQNEVTFDKARIHLQYFLVGEDEALTVPFPEVQSSVAGCPVKKELQVLRDGQWTAFPAPEDEPGGFSLSADTTDLTIAISREQYFAVVQHRHSASTDDLILTMEMRFQAGTEGSLAVAHSYFDIVVEGPQNFCRESKVQLTVEQCDGDREQDGRCPNEQIYLALGQQYQTPDGKQTKSRDLLLNSLSNWWSYEAVGADGSIETRRRDSGAITWSAKGSDGSDCSLDWEVVMQTRAEGVIPYSAADPRFSAIVGNIDQEKGAISIAAPDTAAEVAAVYSDYFDDERKAYKLTLGYRVWNTQQKPLDKEADGALLLFDVFLETEEPYCSAGQPSFAPDSKGSAFYLTEAGSDLTLDFLTSELKGIESGCSPTRRIELLDTSSNTWHHVQSTALPFVTSATDTRIILRLSLTDLESPSGEIASFISAADRTLTYRVLAYDTEQRSYAPVQPMASKLAPAEKRIAIQTVTIDLKDGTFIDTAVTCGNCDLKGLVISYQDKGKDVEALTKTLSPFEDAAGRPLELSCTNPDYPARGDCPIAWQVGFFDAGGQFTEFSAATENGLSKLASTSVGKNFYNLLGWSDTASPADVDLTDYYDRETERFVLQMGLRYYNSAS